MKKATALLLTLTMLLTMAGCSMTFINESKGESAKDPKDPPAAEPREPAVPAPEQTGAPDMDAAGADTGAEYVIYVSHEDVTLKSAGETFRFTVWDSNGNDPDVCTYTSADPAVAAVDEFGGEVTAAAPGTTTITAHVEFGGEKRDFVCIVRCEWEGEAGSSGESVTASHTDVTLFHAGETVTMSAQGVSGIYANTFVSADPGVAAVDKLTGEITAVAPGTTTVTMHVECEAGQFDFDCTVRCSWEDTGDAPVSSLPASGAAALPSLSDFFTTLQGKYDGLGAMMVMEGELLSNYYPGLDAIASVEEVCIQETMISISNVAVGLVKLSADASPDDVTAVQNILQARIDTQAGGGAWYPASCETWEQGVITSTSNVVGMFVYPDEAQAMADLFTEAFSN
ncbi:MAG: Ig domain-containing protein [Oscillibacter sp.]|nr:Ig domain-containing protein [Oscillibacter sp.]